MESGLHNKNGSISDDSKIMFTLKNLRISGKDEHGTDVIKEIETEYVGTINKPIIDTTENPPRRIYINDEIKFVFNSNDVLDVFVESKINVSFNLSISTDHVRSAFPNGMYDSLNFSLQVTPKLHILKDGITGFYETENYSNCIVIPQYDCVVTEITGNEKVEYPGTYLDNIPYICPVSSKNYLQLYGSSTKFIEPQPSFRIN